VATATLPVCKTSVNAAVASSSTDVSKLQGASWRQGAWKTWNSESGTRHKN